jgi:hypothetical protein
MAQDGRPLEKIGAFLGQKDSRSTRIYAHHHPSHMREEQEAIAKRRGMAGPRERPPSDEEHFEKILTPRELANQLVRAEVDDGKGGLRVMKTAEIEKEVRIRQGVTRNVALSAATKAVNALNPGNRARRTHKAPIARTVGAATISAMQVLSDQGKTQKEIAKEIGADEKTVRKYLSRRVAP